MLEVELPLQRIDDIPERPCSGEWRVWWALCMSSACLAGLITWWMPVRSRGSISPVAQQEAHDDGFRLAGKVPRVPERQPPDIVVAPDNIAPGGVEKLKGGDDAAQATLPEIERLVGLPEAASSSATNANGRDKAPDTPLEWPPRMAMSPADGSSDRSEVVDLFRPPLNGTDIALITGSLARPLARPNLRLKPRQRQLPKAFKPVALPE